MGRIELIDPEYLKKNHCTCHNTGVIALCAEQVQGTHLKDVQNDVLITEVTEISLGEGHHHGTRSKSRSHKLKSGRANQSTAVIEDKGKLQKDRSKAKSKAFLKGKVGKSKHWQSTFSSTEVTPKCSKETKSALKMKIVNVQSLSSESETQNQGDKDSKSSLYYCDLCKFKFKTKMSFNLHRYSVHGEISKSMCINCGRQMELEHELEIHNIFQCRKLNRKYECGDCKLKFTTSKEKCNHPCTKDPNKPLYCPRENCTFKGKVMTTLSEHMSRHLGIKQFLCGTCGNSFAAKKDLDRHMDIHKPSKDCVCQVCGTSYKSQHALRAHIRKHKNKDRYKCEYCPYTSPLYDGYKQHILKHKEPAYECDLCGKCLRSARSLSTHLKRRHTFNRIFTCKYCDFTTKVGLAYASHMKKHKDVEKVNTDEEMNTVDQSMSETGTTPGFASPTTYFSISSIQSSGTPTQPPRAPGNILSISTDGSSQAILGDPSLHYYGEVNISGQNADALMANIVSSAETHDISMITSDAGGTSPTLYSTESITNCPASIALPNLILSESMTSISTVENWNTTEQDSPNH